MAIWAGTQGHRVNAFMFTWFDIPELLLPGCWLPASPQCPQQPKPVLRQPDLLELWLISH